MLLTNVSMRELKEYALQTSEGLNSTRSKLIINCHPQDDVALEAAPNPKFNFGKLAFLAQKRIRTVECLFICKRFFRKIIISITQVLTKLLRNNPFRDII